MSAIQDLTLLGTTDVARRLGVKRATVTELVARGSLPALRLADRWYVEASDLDAFAKTYTPRKRTANSRNARNRQAVMQTLADWHEATAAEIAQAVELHPGNVRKHLVLMEKAGLTARVGEGLWTLTAEGQTSLQPPQAQAS